MKRRTADTSGKVRSATARVAPLSTTGMLGALLLMLPATGQSDIIDKTYLSDRAGTDQKSAVERFTEIREKLLKRYADSESDALDKQIRQPISQWANWSDWRNY